MEFEELQTIWDSQKEKPVFTVKDPRLMAGLHEQREQSRRRLWRGEFAPMFVIGPAMLVGLGLMCAAFVAKSFFIERYPRDQVIMSVWDGVAFVVAIGAWLAVVVPMYLERKRNERVQKVFAPSLREELDRGIAQVEFELYVRSPARVFRIVSLVYISALIFVWEVARLNGRPAPRMLLPWPLWLPFLFVWFVAARRWLGLKGEGPGTIRLREKKRALEEMRSGLDG